MFFELISVHNRLVFVLYGVKFFIGVLYFLILLKELDEKGP